MSFVLLLVRKASGRWVSSQVLTDFRLIEKKHSRRKKIALTEACHVSFIHLVIQYLLNTYYVHDFWQMQRVVKSQVNVE